VSSGRSLRALIRLRHCRLLVTAVPGFAIAGPSEIEEPRRIVGCSPISARGVLATNPSKNPARRELVLNAIQLDVIDAVLMTKLA
jgi:hypothetical protein